MKKGFEGFDKEGAGTITQTTMQVRPFVEISLFQDHLLIDISKIKFSEV